MDGAAVLFKKVVDIRGFRPSDYPHQCPYQKILIYDYMTEFFVRRKDSALIVIRNFLGG